MTYEELRDNIKMELGIEAPDESAPDLEQRIDSNIKLVTDSLQDEGDWFPLKEERTFTITTTTTYDFDADIKEMLFASTTDGEIQVITPEVLRYINPNPSNISGFHYIVPNYKALTFDAYEAIASTLTVYCRVRGDTTALLEAGGGFAELIKYGVLKQMTDAGSAHRAGYDKDYWLKLEKLKEMDAQREYGSELDIKPPEWVITFQNARQGITQV